MVNQSMLTKSGGGKVTTSTGDGVTAQTVGTISIADLCFGMTNNQKRIITVMCVFFNTTTANYSSKMFVEGVVTWTTGPTYTLDTQTTNGTSYYGSVGNPIDSLTLDINSSNLRVRAVVGVSQVCDVYVVGNSFGP